MTAQRTKRKLTKDEKKRAAKLKGLIGRLNNGEHVQNRTLKTWLGAEQYQAVRAAWQEQRGIRVDLADKPEVIKDYEARLRRALFLYHRADAHSSKGQRQTAKALFNQADTAFERTLEFLQEITETDPSLCIWFDRDTAWTRAGNMGLSPTQMPRVMTSRSLDRVGGGDSFASAFIAGLNLYDDPQDSLEFAVAGSALKHSILGDYNRVSRKEVEALMGGDGSGRVQR